MVVLVVRWWCIGGGFLVVSGWLCAYTIAMVVLAVWWWCVGGGCVSHSVFGGVLMVMVLVVLLVVLESSLNRPGIFLEFPWSLPQIFLECIWSHPGIFLESLTVQKFNQSHECRCFNSLTVNCKPDAQRVLVILILYDVLVAKTDSSSPRCR